MDFALKLKQEGERVVAIITRGDAHDILELRAFDAELARDARVRSVAVLRGCDPAFFRLPRHEPPRAMRRMYVLQFEQSPDSKRPFPAPAKQTVASINTHDMPSFAAHWTGADIGLREEMGLLGGKVVKEEHVRRKKMLNALQTFFKKRKLLTGKEPNAISVLQAALRYLAQSESDIVLATLEYLWGETQPQNVPGTSIEKPNWVRKLGKSVEEITQDSKLSEFCRELTRLRKQSAISQ